MDDSITEVIRDNFAWLRRDLDSADVLYRSAFAALADALTADGQFPSPHEAKAAFDSVCGADVRLFAEFCAVLTSRHRENDDADTNLRLPKRVSYLRSQMTDKAFSTFSELCGTLSALYGVDFKSICEDVYYERSDACILPLENTNDGLLMSFRHLLLKYELHIFAVCDVRQNDDSVLTLSLLTADPVSRGDMYELYFPSSAAGTLEDIGTIVRALGGTLVRASTVTSEYSSDADIHACVRMPENGRSAMNYCFDALYPSHMILGNYSNINIRKE